jgi:hypothetical protein
MRSGFSGFRRVCPCRTAVGEAACSVIVCHRCQYVTPMAHDHGVTSSRIPLAGIGKGKGKGKGNREPWPVTPISAKQ